MDKKEYNRVLELLQDLEDIRLIDEAKAKYPKTYTIEEVAKNCNVDLQAIRAKRKTKSKK